MILFLLILLGFLNGCSRNPDAFSEMPERAFEEEPEYTGEIQSIRDLSEAFIFSTGSLRRANNKLSVLCVAANVCQESE